MHDIKEGDKDSMTRGEQDKKEPSHVCIIDETQNLCLIHYSFDILKTDVKQLLDKVFGLQFLHLDVSYQDSRYAKFHNKKYFFCENQE